MCALELANQQMLLQESIGVFFLSVCVCVSDCPFTCESNTLQEAKQRNPEGDQIPGINKTSLASAVTMAKAACGKPVFESVLYNKRVHCIHQL